MAAVAIETVNSLERQRTNETGRRRAGSHAPPPEMRDAEPRSTELPRAASYTYLPQTKEQIYTHPQRVMLRTNFSDADLVPSRDELSDFSPSGTSGYNTPDELELRAVRDKADNLVAALHKSPKIQAHNSQPDDDSSSTSTATTHVRRSLESARSVSTIDTISTVGTASGTSTPRPRAGPQTSFSRPFNRNPSSLSASPAPSLPSSRSTSPQPPPLRKESLPAVDENSNALSKTQRKKSFLRRKDSAKPTRLKTSENVVPQDNGGSTGDHDVSRKNTILRRKSRPVSQIFKFDESLPPPPSITSLPKSFSTDRLPMLRSQHSFGSLDSRAAPAPRLLTPSGRAYDSAVSITRKRDELWNVFRNLDADYSKFASKSTALKANVVRTALLPFLRTYASHPSTKVLRAEDLDRRASILNKWWIGMIEMLHGRNNQSISGTDRPAILDGISGVMDRPEWRLAPSPFCPLNQRMKGTSTPMNRSTTSFASSAQSDFLVESVHHNVRNIFIQNLSSQMAFVVDKMSLRNASASLVTFCGKACAYAFMFVPGMADILVRLWELPMDTLRRVLQENGVGKFDSIADISRHTLSSFPPAVQQLGFESLMKYMKKLRTPPPLPLGTTNIQWWGYWLERWTGRESDLFYVFVKHFHILTQDFLPEDSGKLERMSAPGLLLVHGQILTNLDATMHRDGSQAASDQNGAANTQTFDDLLQGGDPDAVASTLPLPPNNAVRIMAENRLIMLIRDFLSDRLGDHPTARRLFAESFNSLLQTAARGVSMFDHAACYILLDFLEEALPMLVRFEHMFGEDENVVSPDFWRTVCRKMMDSENTMTEVRLYAFLYAIWNTVVCDAGRKDDLCLGLLLDPEVFESRFNHWCPMVRAYFMRLLIWRVGRFDGDGSEADANILETLLARLQTSWMHYLYLRDKAMKDDLVPPPTNPCNPAPSRRLLIIRTDNQPVIPGQSFMSFDGLVKPPPTTRPGARESLIDKRLSVLSTFTISESEKQAGSPASSSDSEAEPRKGIKGFLRSMLGAKGRSKSQGPPQETLARSSARPDSIASVGSSISGSIPRAATDGGDRQRASMSDAIRPKTPSPQQAPAAAQPRSNFSFKFSLEYQPGVKAPPTMRIAPPRLPLPAHKWLQDRAVEIANSTMHLRALEPRGASIARARYCGRALAEWMVLVGECQSFFERRKNEGVPENKRVETPMLGVEVFKRPS